MVYISMKKFDFEHVIQGFQAISLWKQISCTID